METTENEAGTVKVVRPQGHLEAASGARLAEEGREALASGRGLVLDLSEVGFCDSAGLSSLVSLFKRAGEAGRPFVLASPRGNLMSLLELTRLHRVFHIEADINAALAAAEGP